MPVSREDLTDYLLDELPPARRSEVEALLEADPVARAELESLRSVVGSLKGLPSEDVPHRLAFVPRPRQTRLKPGLQWLGIRPATSLWAAAAAFSLALAAAFVWATAPTLSSHAGGWSLSFGSAQPDATEWTEVRLREILREELATRDDRWRQALLEFAQSAAGAESTQSEFAAVRRELAEMHEDAVAGYEFVNAKHEMLRRQLLEFDLAAAPEVRP